ncbi:MAG TPA: hypothetical protein VGK81_09815 [Anaerolineae bacterium]
MSRTQHFLAVCAVLIALCAPVPQAAALEPLKTPITLGYFTLDKTEAAKGDQVLASWSFTGRARKVAVSTASADGTLFGNTWLAYPASSGALTFTVPYSLYTRSPLSVTLTVDGALLSSVSLVITCDNPWFFTPRSSRCPAVPIQPSWAAYQEFEHGRMVWIGKRDYVYVFYAAGIASDMAGRWETFEDNFNEGDPETDPSITPPQGKLQPKRGFGLVWRTQQRVRDVLGWALSPERGYTVCYGGGFGAGKSFEAYMNDADGRIMRLNSDYLPTTWSPYEPGTAVQFTGCGD